MELGKREDRGTLVSIGHLSIKASKTRLEDPWFCVFPTEFQRLTLSKGELALIGALLRSVSGLTERGKVLVRVQEIECFSYQYRQELMNNLAKLGIVRKAGMGIWSINPRYCWAGQLSERGRAIEEFEESGD